MARRIPSVGTVTVSLRRSITGFLRRRFRSHASSWRSGSSPLGPGPDGPLRPGAPPPPPPPRGGGGPPPPVQSLPPPFSHDAPARVKDVRRPQGQPEAY